MNPLLAECISISKSGYAKCDDLPGDYVNPKLVSLGNYLLNNSGLEKTFKLKQDRRKSPTQKTVLCFGGGIDSYICLISCLRCLVEGEADELAILSVDYGMPSANQEHKVFKAVMQVLAELRTFSPTCREEFHASFGENGIRKDIYRVIPESFYSQIEDKILMFRTKLSLVPKEDKEFGWKDYIIPARNLVLAALAAEYGDNIIIVANSRKDETVGTPDKTTRFYRSTSEILTQFYGYPKRVIGFYQTSSKLEAVREYLEHGGSIAALKETWSCYTPHEGIPCGQCYACFKRYNLFQALNEEHVFAFFPPDGPNYHQYQLAEQKKRG